MSAPSSLLSVTCPQLNADQIKWKIPEAIPKLLLLLFFISKTPFLKNLFNFISCVLVSDPGTGVTNGCELQSVCWGLNPSPLEEQ